MRILIPTLGFGNAGGYRTLSNFATYWHKQGIKVDFVATIGGKPYYETQANIILVNFKGDVVDNQCPKCKDSMICRSLGIIRFIKR